MPLPADLTLRKIQPGDNPVISRIIKDSLTEFGCNLPGTAFADPETDRLFEQYLDPATIYFVAEVNGRVVGGSGIGKLAGETETCELQKLYLEKEFRGQGIANRLLEACMDFARNTGYRSVYLETKKELNIAVPFYEKRGFVYLDAPKGATGHFNCEIWMSRDI
jgi:putative acetyltransferase